MINRDTFGKIHKFKSLSAIYDIYDISNRYEQKDICRFMIKINKTFKELCYITDDKFRIMTSELYKDKLIYETDKLRSKNTALRSHIKCYIVSKYKISYSEYLKKLERYNKYPKHMIYDQITSLNRNLNILTTKIMKL